MNMKLNQIALAVAAVCAAPAAFALTPAAIDASTLRMWLSGASAPTASVYKGVLTLCAGMRYKDALGVLHTNPAAPNPTSGNNDVHLYVENNTLNPGGTDVTGVPRLPGTAGDRMAYTCTVDTDDDRAGPDLEGKKIVVFHTVEGGSFNYVTPHIAIVGEGPLPNTLGPGGTQVPYTIDNDNIPGRLGRTSNIESLTVTSSGAGQFTCTAATTAVLPNPAPATVDISGENNNIFVYRGCGVTTQVFQPSMAGTRPAVTGNNPDRPEGGFSDTEYLINKLNLNVATNLSTIGGEVPTNIGQVFGAAVSFPLYSQLQKNQGIITTVGGTNDVCDVAANTGFASGACQPNLPASLYTTVANANTIGGVTPAMFGVTAFPGTAGKLQFHRRAITSGTQSASNLRFLNTPCATGEVGGALAPSRSIANGGANYAGVIVTENSSTGGVRTGLNTAATAGEFGMGWLSMENIPLATDQWAIVKLDGIAPNTDAQQRATAMEGSYSAFYELVVFTAADATPQGTALINAVNTSLGNPGITDLPGLFITPLAPLDPAVVASATNVGKVYREGNSCRPAAQ